MALPSLTPEQRAAALAKAAEARQARSALKGDLKSGSRTFEDVVNAAPGDDLIGRTKVYQILTALPGIGQVKAKALMEQAGIADSRRMSGLGHRQAERLKELLAAG
jgi:hypothetical protein